MKRLPRPIPARPLLILAGLWLAVAAAAAFLPAWQGPWRLAGMALGVLAAADALAALRPLDLRLERRMPDSLPLGVFSTVTLRVHNGGRGSLRMELFDHPEGSLAFRGLPRRFRVPGQGHAELSYRVRPTARGRHLMAPAQARVASPLGLWSAEVRLGEPSFIKVYPNFAAVAHYALLATDQRLSQLGVLRRRRRGEGMEFHQLREFRVGDSLRQVDWKATSRMRKPISREYQDERDQQVFFLIDCGRRMRSRDGDLSHFDHALDAVLLLAHVALRQGDAVGLATFSGPERFLEPRKSGAALRHVLNTLYDLEPGTEAPDYLAAATECMARVRKRSLVVVVTNLRDEDDESLIPALQMLRRRHLVLLASLREAVLAKGLQAEATDFDAALRLGALHDYLAHRRKTFEQLQRRGALALDVEPGQLAVGLVNKYLALKRSGRI